MDMTLEDIIKMSKKKNPGGKKPPRQPIKKRPFQNGNSNQGSAKVQRFMESRSSIRQGVLAQRRSNLGGNQFTATKQAAKKAAAMPVRNNKAARWNKPRYHSLTMMLLQSLKRSPRVLAVAFVLIELFQFAKLLEKPRHASAVARTSIMQLSDVNASTLVQRRPVGDAFQNGKGKESQSQTPRTMDALFAQMKAQRMRSAPQQQANSAPGRQFHQQRHVQQQQPRRGRGYGSRNVSGNQ
ncbi:hypothetical protein PR202_ga20761 [Eleusine coracana subsp. coracana]|uniref:Uncharacterized protein n=1 Tax=Eleusine coracana subsp. coracana TaxID=191504 RepID=A0AAV5CZA8_ELECO|nr:hypothetical protein PR202_ga20761 [Eleusine coracana subsp. coracana]